MFFPFFERREVFQAAVCSTILLLGAFHNANAQNGNRPLIAEDNQLQSVAECPDTHPNTMFFAETVATAVTPIQGGVTIGIDIPDDGKPLVNFSAPAEFPEFISVECKFSITCYGKFALNESNQAESDRNMKRCLETRLPDGSLPNNYYASPLLRAALNTEVQNRSISINRGKFNSLAYRVWCEQWKSKDGNRGKECPAFEEAKASTYWSEIDGTNRAAKDRIDEFFSFQCVGAMPLAIIGQFQQNCAARAQASPAILNVTERCCGANPFGANGDREKFHGNGVLVEDEVGLAPIDFPSSTEFQTPAQTTTESLTPHLSAIPWSTL